MDRGVTVTVGDLDSTPEADEDADNADSAVAMACLGDAELAFCSLRF